MPSNARRSFFAFALIFSLSYQSIAFADSSIVDDWDPSLQWFGGWKGFKDEPAPTWDGTLTWSNISSSTVTFTFTGTSVEVFGAFKPVGVWSMQSQYAVDGGSPTTFIPPQEVSSEAYNQSFYHSGTLSAGEHTLKITNLGSQLWLDYFLVNNNGGGVALASFTSSSTGASTTTTTATITQPTTLSASTRVGPSSTLASSSTPALSPTISSTSAASSLSPSSWLAASTSALNSSSPSMPSASDGTSLSSPLPSLPSTSSSDATSPARGAQATQSPLSGSSHSASPGLITGVTVAGVAALAILLALLWWCRRRKQSRAAPQTAPYPFAHPPGLDTSSRPRTEMSFYPTDVSLRDSQYSATLLVGPPASRPASHLADYGELSPQTPHSYGEYSPQTPNPHPHANTNPYLSRRSTDGGVTLAGGPGIDGGADAPSIWDVQSIKSRLPPVYRVYGAGPV